MTAVVAGQAYFYGGRLNGQKPDLLNPERRFHY
jgi:hypothetical protein